MSRIAKCCRCPTQSDTDVQYKSYSVYNTQSAVKATYTIIRYPIK